MVEPIVLATWSFGAIGADAAFPLLAAGESALDAVEAGCRAVEADLRVHTVGVGGLPDAGGRVSLDASIMTAPDCCGGVACIRRHPHPISLARAVMEKTSHVLLVGADADDFGDRMGFQAGELETPGSRERWEQWKAGKSAIGSSGLPAANYEENVEKTGDPEEGHDTVGVLALDRSGRLAGGCSTSGIPFKLPGRVGDSPIIGHGLYVHPEHGAAVLTGTGELMMGLCAAFAVVECMRGGASPGEACRKIIERVSDTYAIRPEHQVGVIALDAKGVWASAALRKGYVTCCRTGRGAADLVNPEFIRL